MTSEIIELCVNDEYMRDLENKKRTEEEEKLFQILTEERKKQWARLETIEKRINNLREDDLRIGNDFKIIRNDFKRIAADQLTLSNEFVTMKKQIEENTLFYRQWNTFFEQLRCAEW
jgi:hypothetical protein